MKKIVVLVTVLVLFSAESMLAQSSTDLNLKRLHTENKEVQTTVIFEPTEKVISLQIAKDGQLAEHTTKVPALLVCVTGYATYQDEGGRKIILKPGDYVKIEPNVKHWIDTFEESNFLLIK